MDIRTVMVQVNAIQLALSITSPVAMTVQKVWQTAPPLSVATPDNPTVLNEITLTQEVRTTQGLRELYYRIRMQLLVYDADWNQAADIALSFLTALIDAFDTTETLNSTCSWSSLSATTGPTVVPMRRGLTTYAGVDLYLDVRLTEGKTYGH